MLKKLLELLPRVFLSLAFCCSYAEQYTLQDLGTLGGVASTGEAINNQGQVTGITTTANGTGAAFLHTSGKMIGLGTIPGGNFSEGTSINSAGVVAGSSGTLDVSIHAAIFSGGQVIDLGTLGGTNSDGNGINASGQIAGYSEIPGDSHFRHAFLYTPGIGLQDIGTLGGPESVAQGINDSGAVVGYSGLPVISPSPLAFLYSNGTLTNLGTLPTGGNVIPLSLATAINAHGLITGYSSAGDRGYRHAFSYSQSVGMADLGTLGGSESFGSAINSSGQIVGKSDTISAGQHGFLFNPGGAASIDLNTLVAGSPLAAYVTLVSSGAINDDGLIVADGVDVRNGQMHAYLLTPISALLASLKAEVAAVGPGTSLAGKVDLAQTYYAANDTAAVCAELTDFNHEVNAQTDKKIQPDLATELTSDDATIQAALGCP